jgi:hypothetical protein
MYRFATNNVILFERILRYTYQEKNIGKAHFTVFFHSEI